MLPTSPSSTSSYDLLSSLSCSSGGAGGASSDSDSDDEIVWLQSSVSTPEPSSESSLFSDEDDDDFVVLSRPRSPSCFRGPIARASSVRSSGELSTEDELSCVLSDLSLRPTPTGGPIARPPLRPTVTNALVLKPPGLSKSQKKKQKVQKKSQKSEAAKTQKAKKVARTGATAAPEFPVVDDASSVASGNSSTSTLSGYEEAATFITSFLSSPTTRDSVCKLTLLQSLILELGLQSSALPDSLTAAKALLRKRAHVNIREYIAVRQQGQAALQKVMHPSRNALVKSIRQKRNPASLKWVKSQGLQALLVTCFH